MNKLKEIVVEVEETTILRSREMTIAGYCSACGEMVEMATPWLAAVISGSSEREIFRLIEAGSVECFEGSRLLACLGCFSRTKK